MLSIVLSTENNHPCRGNHLNYQRYLKVGKYYLKGSVIASDPFILDSEEHILAEKVNPRWRSVLLRIAEKLNAEGVTYKVVGGTTAALFKVPLPVKDIDIESTAEGAYLIQKLFQDYVIQPVAFMESDSYRSHYGRFEIDGVNVEIMGDIHRREGDRWLPTSTSTQTAIELNGVPISSSWLEEETLAYIRRGRLERAALCLPYYERKRLLVLIKGEQATNVI